MKQSCSLPAGLRRLVWSTLAAQSAEQISLAAVPLVAVLALGAGPGVTGLLAAMQTLPFLLLSLPAGLIADRWNRRRLMAGAEAMRALSLIALPLLAVSGRLTVPVLAELGFLGATGTVAFTVAAPALVPALVVRAALARANGRLELARSAAFAAGPALAGALVAWTGAVTAFVLAALLSCCATALLAGLPEPARPVHARPHPMQELRDGARFVVCHRLLRPILLTALVWNTSWFILQAGFVPYALHRLGLSAAGIGASLGLYGAGMVVGALLAPRIGRAIPFGALIALGPLASVAAALLLAVTLWLPGFPAARLLPGAAFALFGFGPILWTIAQTTLRQAVTPDTLLGRVSALMTMATFGARPLGAAIGGLAGVELGLAAPIALACCGFVLQAMIIMVSPVPRLATMPDEASPDEALADAAL
jgi:predicted MFS family arabinose efflux permease